MAEGKPVIDERRQKLAALLESNSEMLNAFTFQLGVHTLDATFGNLSVATHDFMFGGFDKLVLENKGVVEYPTADFREMHQIKLTPKDCQALREIFELEREIASEG